LRRAYPELKEKGIDIVMVGMGDPAQTAQFIKELDLPYPVLSDANRAAYRAYKTIEAGAKEFLSPKGATAMIGSMLRGNRGGKPVGNVQQLGGVYVIDQDGMLRWSKPSTYAGDHASVDEIAAAAARPLRRFD
jgi:alkyl hydroperoxide reductase subunit AhpC